jgi:hypothetical protein
MRPMPVRIRPLWRVLVTMRGEPNDVERLLRDARPKPRPEFVEQCAAALFAERPRVVVRRLPPRVRLLLPAGGLAALLAALILILGIAGQLPFGLQGDGRVKAKSDCRTVVKVQRERRPVLAIDERGNIVVRHEVQLVRRPVKRCR